MTRYGLGSQAAPAPGPPDAAVLPDPEPGAAGRASGAGRPVPLGQGVGLSLPAGAGGTVPAGVAPAGGALSACWPSALGRTGLSRAGRYSGVPKTSMSGAGAGSCSAVRRSSVTLQSAGTSVPAARPGPGEREPAQGHRVRRRVRTASVSGRCRGRPTGSTGRWVPLLPGRVGSGRRGSVGAGPGDGARAGVVIGGRQRGRREVGRERGWPGGRWDPGWEPGTSRPGPEQARASGRNQSAWGSVSGR